MQTTKANALYAGADLHGNNVFRSLCDLEGNNVFRKRVKTNLDAVNAVLDPYWKRIGHSGSNRPSIGTGSSMGCANKVAM